MLRLVAVGCGDVAVFVSMLTFNFERASVH